MSSLAILILTCNEEDNIVSVVENAKKCTNEVVVIDSGSTDRTVELAKEHGAKVAFRAWTNDFSAQRNFALEQTDADWVLYLDADERLNDEVVAEVKKIVSGEGMDHQYSFERKSVAFGTKFNHGVLKPDHVLRMFPGNQVKWVNKVHEHSECGLPVKALPGHIEHYTYKIGITGKGSSASIPLSGQRMHIKMGKELPWEKCLRIVWAAFLRCLSFAQAF